MIRGFQNPKSGPSCIVKQNINISVCTYLSMCVYYASFINSNKKSLTYSCSSREQRSLWSRRSWHSRGRPRSRTHPMHHSRTWTHKWPRRHRAHTRSHPKYNKKRLIDTVLTLILEVQDIHNRYLNCAMRKPDFVAFVSQQLQINSSCKPDKDIWYFTLG